MYCKISSLHNRAPAGFIAAAAIAGFATAHGLGLDDRRDGGRSAGRHYGVSVDVVEAAYASVSLLSRDVKQTYD
ncbi:hypothetical protein OPT61_g5341 [Boeremia exigua]|uniref:Uncharacterized protein n=1 Tax=Boeremia exigua TaxID=749465 RepID=A0ACC2IAS9_9PLEO|nr:hypothetical protein OPT61_g5341 [Boeremia exigua]